MSATTGQAKAELVAAAVTNCVHANTTSVREDDGATLFRCNDCGAVRGSDPESWRAPAKPESSLDATADALLTRVAQFFGECVGGDTFCGLGIDEARDENGVLQYLRLVPCDLVNDQPVRRIAK